MTNALHCLTVAQQKFRFLGSTRSPPSWVPMWVHVCAYVRLCMCKCVLSWQSWQSCGSRSVEWKKRGADFSSNPNENQSRFQRASGESKKNLKIFFISQKLRASKSNRWWREICLRGVCLVRSNLADMVKVIPDFSKEMEVCFIHHCLDYNDILSDAVVTLNNQTLDSLSSFPFFESCLPSPTLDLFINDRILHQNFA